MGELRIVRSVRALKRTRVARAGLAFLGVVCLLGCAAPERRSPIHRLETTGFERDGEAAAVARSVAERDYARIAEVLEVDPTTAPAKFNIRLREEVWRAYHGPSLGFAGRRELSFRYKLGGKTRTLFRAPVSRRRIDLGMGLLRQSPERLPETLRHEMTHLYQTYASGAPEHWREGIADYVAYELGAEEAECLECTVTRPMYTDGYECAAALLRFIAEHYEPRIAAKLHAQLVRGNYSDEFFLRETGKALEALWEEFRQGPRYSVDAWAGLKFRERLKEHQRLHKPGSSEAAAPDFFREFINSRPSGRLFIEACDHLEELREKRKLPGPKAKPTFISFSQREVELPSRHPARIRINMLYDRNEKDLYRYELVRESPGAEWDLRSVQKIDNRTGKILATIHRE